MQNNMQYFFNYFHLPGFYQHSIVHSIANQFSIGINTVILLKNLIYETKAAPSIHTTYGKFLLAI